MAYILDQQQGEYVHNLLVKQVWFAMIPNWADHLERLQRADSNTSQTEFNDIQQLMNEAMSKWKLSLSEHGWQFEDDDAYYWFMHTWN